MGNIRLNLKSLSFILPALLMACQLWAGDGTGNKIYLDSRMDVVKNAKHAAYYQTVESAGDKGFHVKAYFMSGELKMDGYYKDEAATVPNGIFTYYYKNGKKESTGNFSNGMKTGVWQRFNPDGSKKAEKVYKDFYDVVVYEDADVMPSFPGGQSALATYLQKHIIYPETAKKAGKEGTVVLQFVVDRQGKLSEVSISQGVTPELNTEAMRVVSEMPNWIPGKRGNNTVKVKMQLPIKFTL